jgi:hypothetical protein
VLTGGKRVNNSRHKYKNIQIYSRPLKEIQEYRDIFRTLYSGTREEYRYISTRIDLRTWE